VLDRLPSVSLGSRWMYSDTTSVGASLQLPTLTLRGRAAAIIFQLKAGDRRSRGSVHSIQRLVLIENGAALAHQLNPEVISEA
jgi:hypothetical protein